MMSGNVIGTGGTAGTKCQCLTYNGLAIERSSNTFIINGAEITVKKETTAIQLLFLQHQM